MQRRRRYDLKLSGLTGHVLDLFLLLTNSPDPTRSHKIVLLDMPPADLAYWMGNFVRKLYGNEYLVCSFGKL